MPDQSGGARFQVALDGIWQFRHGHDRDWRDAPVPMPWQAAFADLRQTSGRGVYRRSFHRPKAAADSVVLLRFGAVSYLAEVSVNGTLIAAHEGGYLPFDCIIPGDLLREENELEVVCILPDGDPATADGLSFAEIPHGKQSWYGPVGGIWQSVTLETRNRSHLEHCAIRADLGTGQLTATLTTTDAATGATARLTVIAPDGTVAAEATLPVTGPNMDTTLNVPDIRPWSPDTPDLYNLRIDLIRDEVVDTTEHSFGFRSIEARDGRILLNGKPFYMRGALDQDYYPDGIVTPPSLEFLEDQARKAKALGLNTLRIHIKVPDPRYYEVADRVGLVIWTEIPNVGTFTPASARRMRETMQGILRRDGNHPSIAIWTLINEDWGTRLCEDATHRRWLRDTFDWLKALDPTRLVVDNSPCHGNFHVKTDLNDFHYYRSVPERRVEWDALTREFAAGADWTFSPFGDAERRGDEPLLVSEFGVWGLTDPATVPLNGSEPWWFETGASWGDGAAYPHGIEGRYDALRLDSVFGSFDAYIAAAQWYQFANLKYQIETMRAHPSIMGYVITEFTDVHWESNGLLDMNREPRAFGTVFPTINADIVIVPGVDRYSGTEGEIFRFSPAVATGGATLSGATLSWRAETGETGTIGIPDTASLSVASLGNIDIFLPAAARNRMFRVDLSVTVGRAVVATNQIDIALYARRATSGLPKVASGSPALSDYAAGLGYPVVAAGAADVILSHALDAADIMRMQAGARYVVLADGTVKTNGNLRVDTGRREQPFIPVVDDTPGLPGNPEGPLPNINLVQRHGTLWRGDWIAGFSWIRRKGPFADIPGGPLVDLSFDRVIPHHVMTGFRAWEYGGPVHAGVTVGWVHKPAALIAERQVGEGRLVASTFRLMTDPPGADPVAAHLFDCLVRAATGPASGAAETATVTEKESLHHII